MCPGGSTTPTHGMRCLVSGSQKTQLPSLLYPLRDSVGRQNCVLKSTAASGSRNPLLPLVQFNKPLYSAVVSPSMIGICATAYVETLWERNRRLQVASASSTNGAGVS